MAKATAQRQGLRSALIDTFDKTFMTPPTLSQYMYTRGWSLIFSGREQKALAQPSNARSRCPGPENYPPHAIVALQNGTTHTHKHKRQSGRT